MLTCRRPECTVAETGRCALNNDPATCPERTDVSVKSATDVSVIAKPPLGKPVERPRFPHSLALSPDEIRKLTGRRYHFLLGILSAPKAGKTALVVSLYLLAASGKLKGYEIADSQTLMGIDDISRGARRWNEGQVPEEMTIHTEPIDERTAGFLHFRLKRLCDGEMLDLLFPDLPGEWSNSLIDHNRTDRLSFLRSADVLWITVDGAELLKSRQQALHRTQLLLQRIRAFLGPQVPQIIIAISHFDKGKPEERSIKVLEDEAKHQELAVSIINVASFSDEDSVAPGTGLLELLTGTFELGRASRTAFWPDTERPSAGRYITRYRPSMGSQ